MCGGWITGSEIEGTQIRAQKAFCHCESGSGPGLHREGDLLVPRLMTILLGVSAQ